MRLHQQSKQLKQKTPGGSKSRVLNIRAHTHIASLSRVVTHGSYENTVIYNVLLLIKAGIVLF